MMAENPAAFPSVCLDDPGHPASVSGMSLRDWFAGQALAGYVGNRELQMAAAKVALEAGRSVQAGIAGAAYDFADAMLSERKARQS